MNKKLEIKILNDGDDYDDPHHLVIELCYDNKKTELWENEVITIIKNWNESTELFKIPKTNKLKECFVTYLSFVEEDKNYKTQGGGISMFMKNKLKEFNKTYKY